MGKKLQGLPIAAALSAIVLAILLSACGSSSSGSSSSSTSGSSASAGGKGNPLVLGAEPGNTNSKYARFGAEASSSERAAASEVLAESFEAREAADFATQCETLSGKAQEEITEATNRSKASLLCASALKKLATPLNRTKEFRHNNFGGLLAALRVKGNMGYALYHGTDKKDWTVAMVKEAGVWKARAIVTIEVP
jgi:hypothetical protein